MNKRQRLAIVKERVVGAAHKVANTLGSSFSKDVYVNALAHELSKVEEKVEQNYKIDVKYDGVVVGSYTADLLIDDSLLVNLETVDKLTRRHQAESSNCLMATGLPMCVVLNFGAPKLEVKRITSKI